MRLFNSYQKAGPGVAKNAPKKSPFYTFFEIYFRKFWKLIALNMLYFIFCIPIFTIGPATAAFTKILKNYSQEKNAFLWSDFFEAFKKNFLQALPVGLVDVLLATSIFLGVQIYPSLADKNQLFYIPFFISISAALTVIIMHFYIYLMIVSIDIPLSKIIRNSFILTCVAIKKNIITLLAISVVIVGNILLVFLSSNILFVLSILLIPCFTLSLVGLIVCFNSYPVIQKYIINPYYEASGEENPEYQYLKPIDANESIFTDKGGSEKPVNIVINKKGKTIS